MKKFLLPFFLSMTFLAHGQIVDSVAIHAQLDSLITINKDLLRERKLVEAMEVIQHAKEIAESAFGEENKWYGRVIIFVARTYMLQGDLESAEDWFLKSKGIVERGVGKDHENYASSLNNLAIVYNQMTNYEKCLALFEEAKELIIKKQGKINSDYARAANNLGIVYRETGEYKKAEAYLFESLVVREKIQGKESFNYAANLKNIGVLKSEMGEYEAAELFYLEALTIMKKIVEKEDPYYLSALNSLALLYEIMGQFKKAELIHLEVLAARKKVFGENHFEVAQTLNNLAVLYEFMEYPEKIEPLLLEALRITKDAFQVPHPTHAISLASLANWYISTEEYEKAEPLIIEALSIRASVFGEEHPDYATTLFNHALMTFRKKNYEKAEELYLEVKTIREKALGKNHPEYVETLNDLGVLYDELGKAEQAKEMYSEAAEIEKASLIQAARHFSETELLSYIRKYSKTQNIYFSFAQKRFELSETLFDNTLFYKGFLLNAQNKIKKIAQSDTTSAAMYLQLKSYHHRLASEYAYPISDRRGVGKLEEKANLLERKLTRMVAGFEASSRQVNWKEVQSKLSQNQVAIEFVHYQFYNTELTDSTMYAALVVLPNEEQPKFIPLFEEKSLNVLLQQSQTNRSDYIENLYRSTTDSKNLFNLIFQPLQKELEGIETIYFSPTGLLHRLNLNAIHFNETETLADHFNLVQLNSTRELVISDSTKIKDNTAILYGGIEYNSDSLALSQANADFVTENTDITSRGDYNFSHSDSTLRGKKWAYLKWTAVEVVVNEKILESADFETELKTKYAATEEAFQQIGKEGKSPRILHLATHGFFYPDPKKTVDGEQLTVDGSEPIFKISDHPMIRSGLLLAGANHVWEGSPPLKNMEDGILTAYEISQMDLSNTELVVLSACETGLGDIEGNEGVYGLQRAFKIAGAKHLIMSLWQVPDFQTQELMTTFYKNWLTNKMSIREAFKVAQKEVRKKNPNPFYWAGFVLVE